MPPKGYRAPRVTVECARDGCDGAKEVLQSDIDRNKSGRFFCDAECRNIAGSKPRTLPDIECEHCGEAYRPATARTLTDSRYCSKECKDRAAALPRVEAQCPGCGGGFTTYVTNAGGHARTYCSHKCATDSNVTTGVGRTVNGRAVTEHVSGYLQVYVPGRGRMMEHRYVMEQALGRELLSDEQVHHVNHVKTDNRLENLALLAPREHAQETREFSSRRSAAKAARIRELEAELVAMRRQLSEEEGTDATTA